MTTSPFPRNLVLVLTGVLTVPLAACVCPDDPWNGGGRSSNTRDDDGKWPRPTPPNEDPHPPSTPQRDAGSGSTNTVVDARKADTGATNAVDSGAPKVDAGVPPAADAGAPPAADGGSPSTPRDAGAGADGATCPTNTCGAAPVCQFDNQCGPGGRCRNGACEHACATIGDCGTGQVCAEGLCVTPTTPGGQCVYDRDCGGAASCINGVCHARCPNGVSCAAGDRCVAGVCQPDTGPRPQCRGSAECPAGQDCVNAVCRTPCETDVECCEGSSGSTCRAGVCVTDHEAAPQCRLASQCAAAQSCIDGMCGVD